MEIVDDCQMLKLLLDMQHLSFLIKQKEKYYLCYDKPLPLTHCASVVFIKNSIFYSVFYVIRKSCPDVIKLYFMLNSTENEVPTAHRK